MTPRRTQLVAAVCVALFLVAFFLAPVVPYSQSINIPYAYESGVKSCVPPSNIIVFPPTANYTKYEECIASYKYPPAHVAGYASLAYRLLGVGQPPFPSQLLVTQGNYSLLVFFSGDKAVAADSTWYANVTINPTDIVEIQDVSFQQAEYGLLNVTIVVKNIGDASIGESSPGSTITMSIPGYSSNSSINGLIWIGGTINGYCKTPWRPGQVCTVSQTVVNTLPLNKSFSYYIEVRGTAGDTYFFYRERFVGQLPAEGVGSQWVSRFIGQVNQARSGINLVENTTLDRFATLRFNTAASQPEISDYGLATDTASFFGANGGSGVEEILLYPGNSSTVDYASFLANEAPGHWSALTNTSFTQYGYFVGQAPYVEVTPPCPVYEIPSAGINVTQYFQSHGCATTVKEMTWLVIDLGR